MASLHIAVKSALEFVSRECFQFTVATPHCATEAFDSYVLKVIVREVQNFQFAVGRADYGGQTLRAVPCEVAAPQSNQRENKENFKTTWKIKVLISFDLLATDLSVSSLLFLSPSESCAIPASVRLLLLRSSSLSWDELMLFASFSQQFIVSLHAFRLQ